MATSSDWLAALAAPPASLPPQALGLPPAACAPRWFEALGEPCGFRAGAPFAGHGKLGDAQGVAPVCEPVPDAAPAAATPPDSACEPAPADLLAAAAARAFAEGEIAGRAAASAQAADELAHARALRLTFRTLDQAAMGVLAEELAATVAALCAKVLGDYALDSAALAARCEAAAARLGGGWQGAVLHLHPDDAAGLPHGALAGWQIVTDPAMERGALHIESADGAVRDTPADWRRALAEALKP